MKYTIVYQKVQESGFPEGYYYTHIPALDITTHGIGIEGAKAAALDLTKLWIEEKKANGESVPVETDILLSQIELDDAILGA